jgi:hypothetical protein
MNFFERLRYLRHHLLRVWPRHKLSTGNYRTGLGPSAWSLHGLVRWLAPDDVIETGSARGWSAHVSAMGLDPCVEVVRAGYPCITLDRDCGLPMVQRPVGGVPLLTT